MTLLGLVLVGSSTVRSMPPVLLLNPSPSAPRGWYLLGPEAPTRVGQYVLARLSTDAARLAAERHYLPLGIHLLKSVAALGGDYVCADGGQVRTKRPIVATPLVEDAQHRKLIAWQGCLVLSAGRYFLLSATNPASFDSRYFGPVERKAIVGHAVPLLDLAMTRAPHTVVWIACTATLTTMTLTAQACDLVPWETMIEAAAKYQQVNSALIRAVIRVESNDWISR